jgi:hypothetical protein
MKHPRALISLIEEKIHQAQTGQVYDEVIYNDSSAPVLNNEYLFFIKPEITMPSDTIRLEPILDLIFDKLDEFGFTIHDARILSASYLENYNLIDQHYGIIAEVSNQGKSVLTTGAKKRFREQFGVEADKVTVLGGMEFLRKYPFFNYHSIDCLWQNFENFKLASGTYAEKLRVDLETLYVLNGFHPKQLKHFTEQGRSIVLFRLSGDLPWSTARASFAGATNPAKATEGSLRHTLLERKAEFGLPEVSQSYNGIHLSAGPVEGLIELHRFDTDLSRSDLHNAFQDFSFGRALVRVFGEIPQAVLDNVKVEVNDQLVSIFDLTEEVDSEDAVRLLEKYFRPYSKKK